MNNVHWRDVLRAVATTGTAVLAGLVLLDVLVLGFLVAADPAKKDDPAAADQQVVSSKATIRPAASSVSFRKELGLPFPSLSTLGSRIDAARRAPDPVALAHAANELAVAEKVSGKSASLTSKHLMQESAELASLRKQEAELKAVLQVSTQVAFEEEKIANLRSQLAFAQAQTKREQEAFAQNREPTYTPRQVVVNNYTPQYVDIWVNGSYMTQVLPGSSQAITIQQRYNPVVLTAYGNDDNSTWGPRNIWGRFSKYTWNIN